MRLRMSDHFSPGRAQITQVSTAAADIRWTRKGAGHRKHRQGNAVSIPVRHAHSRQGSRGSRPQGPTTHGSSHGHHHQRRIATQRATFRRIGHLARLAPPVCPAPARLIPVGSETFRGATAAGRQFFGLLRRHCRVSPSRHRLAWSRQRACRCQIIRETNARMRQRQPSATCRPPRECGTHAPTGTRRDASREDASDAPLLYHIRTAPSPRVPGQPEGAPCLIRP